MKGMRRLVKIPRETLTACDSSFDISRTNLPSEPPTPPTKTSNALRADVQNVTVQLSTMKRQWDNEKQQLLGEKAVLQETTHRLNAQIASAKDESQKARSGEKQRDVVQNVRVLSLGARSVAHDAIGPGTCKVHYRRA